ncbi:MAG TPA: hypothetical protein VFP12_04670 [Allosphingosinicella sp.]|nr:hypothetical protein [Allosphingosinicella sp.]
MKYFGRISAAALLLAGCSTVETSLSTRPTLERTEQQTALEGIAYSLPMLQYQVDIAYKVISCPGGVDDSGKPTTLAVNVEPVASAEYPAGESYTVDYQALSSPLKITDFSIEEHEKSRTLKAINASADDRSLEVIKSLAEVGIAAASLATGNPAGIVAVAASQGEGDQAGAIAGVILGRAQRTMQGLRCTKAATDALAAQKLAQGQVTTETGKLDAARLNVETILIPARLGMASKKDRAALVQFLRNQSRAATALATAQENLKKADKTLSFLDTVRWPSAHTVTAGPVGWSDAANAWAEKLFALDQVEIVDSAIVDSEMAKIGAGKSDFGRFSQELQMAVRMKLISALAAQGESARSFCEPANAVFSCLAQKAGVHASLIPEVPLPTERCGPDRDTIITQCLATSVHAVTSNAPHRGVFIRQPVRARLVLCDSNAPCFGSRKPLLMSKWDTAPQLGQLRFVPLKNGAFQNNALSITLREDGSIVKFQYAEKAAIAAGMAAAAANVATKLNDFDEKREKERKQAITDARAEIAYARTETAYERTEAAAIRTDAAAIRADEIAQIQYEIDKLTKQKALLDVRFPKAAEDPVVAREFTNETIRIQASVAQLQARLAELEAERALANATSG